MLKLELQNDVGVDEFLEVGYVKVKERASAKVPAGIDVVLGLRSLRCFSKYLARQEPQLLGFENCRLSPINT